MKSEPILDGLRAEEEPVARHPPNQAKLRAILKDVQSLPDLDPRSGEAIIADLEDEWRCSLCEIAAEGEL